MPAPARGEVVRVSANKLREYKQELGYLVALENGSILSGSGEVQEMIDICDFTSGRSVAPALRSLDAQRAPRLHRMYEQWQPLGVVGVVSAFNFPIAVWRGTRRSPPSAATHRLEAVEQVPLCAIAVQRTATK